MGTRGMSYSLQSRDLIADAVETAAGGHWLDGMVVVPGCDKNMPGVLMARALLSYYLSLSLFSHPSSFLSSGSFKSSGTDDLRWHNKARLM